MKKVFYCAFFMIMMACSLSDQSDLNDLNDEWMPTYQEICGPVSDIIQYPIPWTSKVEESFVIPDETIHSMNICGLLETWLGHPKRVLGPWCTTCSDLSVTGVSRFNNAIANDKVMIELFDRDDCVPVLLSKYQWIIRQNGEKTGIIQCFEMLLASDLFMSKLSAKERIQLMEMALKMLEKNSEQVTELRHIMVAIMKAFNYTPFLTEVEKYHVSFIDGHRTGFSEWVSGYDVCGYDVVEKYAKQFINKKTKYL